MVAERPPSSKDEANISENSLKSSGINHAESTSLSTPSHLVSIWFS